MNFAPGPASRVELQGTSTLGRWTSRSSDIRGKVLLDTDENALTGLFARIESAARNTDDAGLDLALSLRSAPVAEISVPVMSLHGDSTAMDRDMQNALGAREHPSIEYVFGQLQKAQIQRDPQNAKAGVKLRIEGKLFLAGVGRETTLDATVKRDSAGHFFARAQTELLMTDFGVTPPGKVFGLIKANDRVLVIFDLDFVLIGKSNVR